MKKPTYLWISLLAFLAILSSACAFGGLVMESQSGVANSQPGETENQPEIIESQPIATEEQPAAAGEEAADLLPAASQTQIVMVGMLDEYTSQAVLAVEAAGDYQVSVNSPVDSANLVLFFANAVDGVVPRTIAEFERRTGETFTRAAILITADDLNPDQFMRNYIEQDFHKIMAEYLPGGEAENWPVLLSTSPDLASQLDDLLNGPEQATVLQYQPYVQAPNGPPAPGQKRIVIIGRYDEGSTDRAVDILEAAGDYQVAVNYPVESADLVLFFVHAPDGPMPRTRVEIEKRTGEPFPRAAVLLTGVDTLDDAELLELVELEYRELMTGYLPGGEAETWDVLRSNSPDLASQLSDLLNRPEQIAAIQPRPVVQAPAVVPVTSPKRIILVGNRSDAERAVPLIEAAGNFEVLVDSPLDHSDLVLFTVSAVDGPMINTITEIENRIGEPFPRAAFLLTGDEINTDAELQALIVLEFREIMTRFLPDGEAEYWEVLLSTNPDLATQLSDLLNAAEQFTVLH